MKAKELLSSLHFLRPLERPAERRSEKLSGGWAELRRGGRKWEEHYHRRWQHDKTVRSTHGCNCTGGCSWMVYVKDGIIAWETQATDYPGSGPERPDYEPRGCPRGATFSWYVYSPVRVKYPYMRSALLQVWREALKSKPDPVEAWESIVGDPAKTRRYKAVRGKGGFVRVTWEEASTLIAASLVCTIKKYGPDRVFGFTPIPAMSMVSFSSGARFLSLIGGSVISFYDWYSDLPPASPQVWGEQTDVPESADWYNADYMIVWGTNLPQTRSPDAHFYVEARYRGAKVAAVSPDYSEYAKFADRWLPAKAGTDGALAMAMTFVILKEFYLDKETPYFTDYVKQFTDLPFAVVLEKRDEAFVSERFLRASDLGMTVSNGDWKTVFYDSASDEFVVPNGSIGFRWEGNGLWNLHLKDSESGSEVDPLLSYAEGNDDWVPVDFPYFGSGSGEVRRGTVPVKKVSNGKEDLVATTVFDLMLANLGLDRGHGGDCARDYDDPRPFTPAWQEPITGVKREDAVMVAREFAENAEKTRGRSMIFLGAGSNHWYHNDSLYRAILNLTGLCGCQGVNGGGWAHYVGQEKVRPLAGWATLAFALDWVRPPRHQNGTSFFYFASDLWRYETVHPSLIASPLYKGKGKRHVADCNVVAARLGWLPSYPQFNENPLEICKNAADQGARKDEEILSHVVERLKKGDLTFALEDPNAPENTPRILFLWRANVLGASAKGHEYFLKHLLGADHAVLNKGETEVAPEEMRVRDPDPDGKLDLLVTSEIRMCTSPLYSDVVLPAASWYEMHDLNTTDLHPFIHPFNPAVDPLWESKTNWEQFKTIAEKFSSFAAVHLGARKDLVAVPLQHDSPAEIAQPLGRVKDWKKGEAEAVPGKTMPNLKVVERDFPNVYKMMTALGPLTAEKGVSAKGISWNAADEVVELAGRVGTIEEEGVSKGMPRLLSGRDASEAILVLSPETNGRVACKSWKDQEAKTGVDLVDLSVEREGERFTFGDLQGGPRKVITSPIWSGMETDVRTYSPFVVNIERKVPFRTLTGRAHFYLDHEWVLAFGDGLPTYRPPLDMEKLGSTKVDSVPKSERELVLQYLTPHSKWSIHSSYSDAVVMLTLFRGGEAIWINNEDAAAVGLQDHDWVECYNVNGVVMARAVVSPRIPRGKAFMYHAQERLINTPGSKISKKRGGTHNSVTRIVMKPTQMIGGYAQLSYFINYYGPTGCNRDEVVVVRKAGEVEWYED